MEKEILQTSKKWFKSIIREYKYREIMHERGWKMLVKNSYPPDYVCKHYTTRFDYLFERI